MVDPVAYARRSPLRRRLDAAGAAWRELGDVAIAESVGDAPLSRRYRSSPTCRRCRAWASKAAAPSPPCRRAASRVEATPNRAFRQPDGGLCLVLAPGEVILLSNLAGDGERLAQLESGLAHRGRGAHLSAAPPRQPCLAGGGRRGRCPEMFAKLCAIDLRRDKFADLAIAQTSIAKMSAILVRADIGADPVFHLLVDSAAALYFCDCLLDAADEFGGRIVGWKALQKSKANEEDQHA